MPQNESAFIDHGSDNRICPAATIRRLYVVTWAVGSEW
jgi:hypothetical protein